jgi:hypothetical protein
LNRDLALNSHLGEWGGPFVSLPPHCKVLASSSYQS